MTDKDFFEKLAIESNYSDVVSAKNTYYALLRLMKNELARRGEIVMPQWGQFNIIEHAAHKITQHYTGKTLDIPVTKTVKFKPYVLLKKYFSSQR